MYECVVLHAEFARNGQRLRLGLEGAVHAKAQAFGLGEYGN